MAAATWQRRGRRQERRPRWLCRHLGGMCPIHLRRDSLCRVVSAVTLNGCSPHTRATKMTSPLSSLPICSSPLPLLRIIGVVPSTVVYARRGTHVAARPVLFVEVGEPSSTAPAAQHQDPFPRGGPHAVVGGLKGGRSALEWRKQGGVMGRGKDGVFGNFHQEARSPKYRGQPWLHADHEIQVVAGQPKRRRVLTQTPAGSEHRQSIACWASLPEGNGNRDWWRRSSTPHIALARHPRRWVRDRPSRCLATNSVAYRVPPSAALWRRVKLVLPCH